MTSVIDAIRALFREEIKKHPDLPWSFDLEVHENGFLYLHNDHETVPPQCWHIDCLRVDFADPKLLKRVANWLRKELSSLAKWKPEPLPLQS